jgi:hypothetical protein
MDISAYYPYDFLVERGQQPPRNELRDVLGVRSLESKVRFADNPEVDDKKGRFPIPIQLRPNKPRSVSAMPC